MLVVAALLVAPYAARAAEGSAAAPFCAASFSAPVLSDLGIPASKDVAEAIVLPKCGSCSSSPCAGAKVNSICGHVPLGGVLQDEFCAVVAVCPVDNSNQCRCQPGPPN